MPEFASTGYARQLFEGHIPQIATAVSAMTKELHRANLFSELNAINALMNEMQFAHSKQMMTLEISTAEINEKDLAIVHTHNALMERKRAILNELGIPVIVDPMSVNK